MWIWVSTDASLLVATAAACALLLALAIDRWWGEPPARLHPVVWMGWYLGALGSKIAPQVANPDDKQMSAGLPKNWTQFSLGALVWLVGAGLVFGVAVFLQNWIIGLSGHETIWQLLLASVALALLLKPMLSWRMLCQEVQAVERALHQSLPAGRERLSWLVSRDTAHLSASEVRESAIESLAENLNDSVIAPIFWFVLLGLPGAAVYRFANTADAMWGYKGIRVANGKGQNWEWAGKWAARADDVLSWLPARITAVLLWGVSSPKNRSFWSSLRQEAFKTPSPNSGWPMAAMALILNIKLAKPGVYVLNPAGASAKSVDIGKAIYLASKAVPVVMIIACTAIFLIAIGWSPG